MIAYEQPGSDVGFKLMGYMNNVESLYIAVVARPLLQILLLVSKL